MISKHSYQRRQIRCAEKRLGRISSIRDLNFLYINFEVEVDIFYLDILG